MNRPSRDGVVRSLIAMAFALLVLASYGRSAQSSVKDDRVWFSPDPGTLDYIRLFEHPEDWQQARHVMSVFKFYQQHTQTPPPSIVGPNSYDALARAGAFRLLEQWGKKIALEAGAVKDFYCTADASGMKASIASSVESLRAIKAAGGTVSYIAMDEPFVSGRERVCGGPALEPTADRVATYVNGVKEQFPNVQIGLIEAYPFSSADATHTAVELLLDRGVRPAFLHMDVDWHLSGHDAFVRDISALKAVADAQNIPFGIIITGYDGNADALYAVDVYALTNLLAATFQKWEAMPNHLIFQSWVVSDGGLLITPNNLDERRVYSHTFLLRDVYRRLRGGLGPATGKARAK